MSLGRSRNPSGNPHIIDSTGGLFSLLQQASHRLAILNSVEQGHGHWDLVHSRLLRLPHKLADRLRHLAASQTDGSMRQRIETSLSRLAHPHKRGAPSAGMA